LVERHARIANVIDLLFVPGQPSLRDQTAFLEAIISQHEGPRQPAHTGSLSTPWQRIRSPLRRLLQTLCALMPLALVVVGLHPLLALIPALYPYVVLARRSIRRLVRHSGRTSLSGEHAIRVLLGLLPLTMLAAHVSRNPISWISVILLALIPLGEPVLSRVSRGRRLRCAGLPGVRLRNSELLPMNVILTVDLIVTFVVTVAIAGHVWSWALLLFVLIAIALAATAAVDTLQRVRKS